MKKTNALFLTIAITLLTAAPSAVYAQSKAKTTTTKKPAWVTKAPTVKATYVGIASVSKRSMNPDGEQTDNAAAPQASSIIVSQLFFNDRYKESGKREAEKKILTTLHLAVDANSLLGDLIVKDLYKPATNSSSDDVSLTRSSTHPCSKNRVNGKTMKSTGAITQ